jgi:23S rRNA (adenine1618-N6)-methyltransferase
MHPRNRHGDGYDFPALIAASPELGGFVAPTGHGGDSIDFADPAAVKALNRTLLKTYYGISRWDLPAGYLCPAVPGRADYIHHLADLLATDRGGVIPRGPGVTVLDVGVGANCIYPIIGVHDYGWRFVGADVDPVALRNAGKIISAHPALAQRVQCRLQRSPSALFHGITLAGEIFDACVCNPPFHASAAAAAAGTRRKVRHLTGKTVREVTLNFGGAPAELWCAGGELAFLRRMVAESATVPRLCRWFTTLVSKSDHLAALEQALRQVRAADVRTIAMAQGQKKSRILAWRFPDRPERINTSPRLSTAPGGKRVML